MGNFIFLQSPALTLKRLVSVFDLLTACVKTRNNDRGTDVRHRAGPLEGWIKRSLNVSDMLTLVDPELT